ncbi:MAG: PKD domain-containing protein [Cyclobacteriaceae bacterium]|nr:PKD domain-containing protein [Cyclobacteriaceae bacterium]
MLSSKLKLIVLLMVLAVMSIQCDDDDLQAPMADFSADLTTVPAGSMVTFTDLSTGLVDFRSWSFPGGNPSTFDSEDPVITYSTPGVYDVTLEVSNPAGSDIETKTAYITVNFEADFSADKTDITAGETIFFTDETMGNPVEWAWSFPGGEPSSSTNQDVAVTYNNAGSYDVILEVSDGTNTDLEAKIGFITVQ